MLSYHCNLGLNFAYGIVVSHHYAGILASKERKLHKTICIPLSEICKYAIKMITQFKENRKVLFFF